MPTLRAFVGVPVDAAVAARMCAVRDGIAVGTVRWIPAENLHLTLKFLGDVEEARVSSIRAAVREALTDNTRFLVTARGLGGLSGLPPAAGFVGWSGIAGVGSAGGAGGAGA